MTLTCHRSQPSVTTQNLQLTTSLYSPSTSCNIQTSTSTSCAPISHHSSTLTLRNLQPTTSHDSPFSSSNLQTPMSSCFASIPHPSHPSTSSSQPVMISGRPAKSDSDMWIPGLNLTLIERNILQSSQWLNDRIISAAQCLLRKQTNGKVSGWQSTLHSQRKGMFHPVPSNSPYVQILHTDGCHWVVVSNMNTHDGSYHTDTVCVYDSGRSCTVSLATKRAICSFVQPKSDSLHFHLMNVQGQPNAYDCGVFAIAYATELVHSCDPVASRWDIGTMRPHLLSCLEAGKMTRFPNSTRRRVPFGMRVHKFFTESIFCVCRMPNDKAKMMIKCDRCLKWFHYNCMDLDEDKSYKHEKWVCTVCLEFVQSLS